MNREDIDSPRYMHIRISLRCLFVQGSVAMRSSLFKEHMLSDYADLQAELPLNVSFCGH